MAKRHVLENYKKLVGEKIRKRREEMGFPSQEDLAAALNTDQSRISRWETGRNLPTGDRRKGLLELLKCDEESIFGIDEPKINFDFEFIARTLGSLTLTEVAHEVKRLREENSRIKSDYPRDVADAWVGQESKLLRLVAMFFLTNDRIFLRTLSQDARAQASQLLATILKEGS